MRLVVTKSYVCSFLGSAFVAAKVSDPPAKIRHALRRLPGPGWLRRLWPPSGKCLCEVALVTLPGGGVREIRCGVLPHEQEVHFPQDVSRAMIPRGELQLIRREWVEPGFLLVAAELQSDDTRQGGSCCVR
jgi:hypothetical protein